jgi:hypothetical protein
MSESTELSEADWRPARVRFMASGRAEQTPVAVELEGRWLGVRLLSEELVAGLDPASPPGRRYRLGASRGRIFQLSPDTGGGWRLRSLPPR